MDYPTKGMHYEDVRRRVKRINNKAKSDPRANNLKQSLIRQAALHEGKGAAKELRKEFG